MTSSSYGHEPVVGVAGKSSRLAVLVALVGTDCTNSRLHRTQETRVEIVSKVVTHGGVVDVVSVMSQTPSEEDNKSHAD